MSDSNSDTSQRTNQTDNRRVIGERGVSAENSTVTINSLDADVMNRILNYGSEQSGQVFDFAGRGLESVDNAVLSALGFGGKALNAALDANADALAFADANSTRNTIASYNFAGDALGEAFSFGTNALNKAFNAADTTTSLVKDAYADAKGRGALTDKIMIGAIIAMAAVAFAAVQK